MRKGTIVWMMDGTVAKIVRDVRPDEKVMKIRTLGRLSRGWTSVEYICAVLRYA